MSLDLRTKSNGDLSYSPSSSSWKRQQRRDQKLVEEDKHQRIVQTPYGRGLIIRTRCGNDHDEKKKNPSSVATTSYEIRLLEWENAGETPHGKGSTILTNIRPMLYTSINYPSVTPRVGDDVICTFGRGRVVDIIPVIITPKKDTNITTTNSDTTNEGGAATNVKEEEQGGEGDQFDDTTEQEEKKESVTITARTTTTTKEGMDDDAPITTEEALSRKGARIFPKYVVSLTSWRLANRSTVRCYLSLENDPLFSVVRKKTLGEMDAYERVELARSQKSAAAQQFARKNYQRALMLYAGAVDAVRYVQHDANSSNEVRADLVEGMVTCSNNAATCCAQLHRWADAIQFASSALVLLDALYAKRGKKIHSILNKDGVPDEKLFGEWKVKSYLLLARAYAERGEHDDAIDVLKKAREIIGTYLPNSNDKVGGDGGDDGKDVKDESLSKTDSRTAVTAAAATSRKHLAAQDKEVRRLLASCIQRKKAEKRKEKQRAQAMFGGGGGGSNSSLSSDKGSSKKEGSASNGGSNREGSVTDLDSKSSKENGKGGNKAKSSSRGLLDMRDNDSDKDEAKGYREDEQELDELNELLKKETMGAKGGRARDDGKGQKTVKKVSFSDVNEVRERANEEEDSDEDEEDVPWFQEHKEALILLGSVGLVGLSMMLLRGRSRG